MLTDAQKEVFEVLKASDEAIDSGEVFNRCQVASKRTVSLSLKQLVDMGLIQKDKDKLYFVSIMPSEQKALTQKAFNKMRVLEEKLWFQDRGLVPSEEDSKPEVDHSADALSFTHVGGQKNKDLVPSSMTVPEDIERDLMVMEKALAPLPQTEYSPQVKVQVLKRLSLLMDNSISSVLDDIVEDLEAVACRTQV